MNPTGVQSKKKSTRMPLKELLEKYSPPAVATRVAEEGYSHLPDEVKANISKFVTNVSKAYNIVRSIGPAAPLIKGVEAVVTSAPKMPERYRGGSPMDNPLTNYETGPLKAFMAFHGSPYKFNVFDAANIGTGQGAKSFGHGVYFAETPEVAKQYMGGPKEWGFRNWDTANQFADKAFMQARGDKNKALQILDNEIKTTQGDEKRNTLTFAKKVIQEGRQNTSIYKVDVPDEWIPEMYDLDKVIDEQNPKVIEKLRKTDWYPYAEEALLEKATTSNPTGLDLLRYMQEDYYPDEVSELFTQAGIPGYKYFDAKSRIGEKGTRNFVVLPGREAQVKILERNSEPIQGFAKGGSVDLEGLHAKYADGGFVDKLSRLGRKTQYVVSDVIGLGPEVKFATDTAEHYFPAREQHNGRGDAMRHLLFQAQLKEKYGETPAKVISWIHENMSGPQNAAEKAMDLHNDEIGRAIGGEEVKDKDALIRRVLQAIEQKEAKTLTEEEMTEGYADGGSIDIDELVNHYNKGIYG